MKRIIFRNSLSVCCFLLLTLIFSFSFLYEDKYLSSVIIGFSGLILSMSLVYLAMRTYRHTVAGGTIRLGKAFKIGLIITLIGSLSIFIYSLIYYAFVDPNFPDRYKAYLKMKALSGGLQGEEAARYLKKLEAMPDFVLTPFFQSFLMFVTAFVIGAVISFIAALLISRRKSVRTISSYTK